MNYWISPIGQPLAGTFEATDLSHGQGDADYGEMWIEILRLPRYDAEAPARKMSVTEKARAANRKMMTPAKSSGGRC